MARSATPPADTGLPIEAVIDDVDAHYARARAAGAEIVTELMEPQFGGKLYSCLDPEGHAWHFGSYDPFAPPGE